MTVHVVPVECVNKAAACFKLLPATVSAWQVHCGRFCVLLACLYQKFAVYDNRDGSHNNGMS